MATPPKRECLFIGVSHTFSLPVVTPDGLEIFDPRSESLSSNDENDPRRRSNLGLRSYSHTDTEFSRSTNAFGDAIHFFSGQSFRSCFVSSPDGQLHDCTSDIVGWSPYPSGPASDKALKFAIQNMPVLMPLNLNDTFNRVSNALRLYDLGQSTEHPDLALMTYPTLSRKHGELVCTAGVREDGSWVRLYPIPFRLLDYKGNPVGVELVRGLHSVVETAKATSGLLVTTSYFTKGARALQDTYKHRLDLADFNRLQGMLKSYKGQLL